MSSTSGEWLAHYSRQSHDSNGGGGSSGSGNWRRRLLCFPYAGVGPQIFRQWPSLLPADIEVVGIHLPGRELRFGEPSLDDWQELLDPLVDAVRAETDMDYVLFGHCLGARVAYEVASRLQAQGCRPANLLIVSACHAPTTASRRPAMHHLPRPAFRDRLREMQGVAEEVLADDAIMSLLEPALRADMKLAETWNPSDSVIPSPIVALCGELDPYDAYDDMIEWRSRTSETFTIHQFSAGHFFLHEKQDAVLRMIGSFLEQ
jgi:medium-chain acyl-[acyl-carrier-protein] hydrolase